MAVALLTAACSFGRPAAAPEPIDLPTYAPGMDAGPAPTPSPTGESVGPGQVLAAPGVSENSSTAVQTAPGGPVVYTGEVLAEDTVPVVAEVPGQVIELNISVGDRVNAGDVLLRIDSTTLEAQRAQALAALEAAQAQVELLTLEPDESDIEAARAAVSAADAAYKRALDGPTAEDLTMAESQLRQAEAAVERAQAAYDQVAWNPLIAALPESLQLQQATLALEAARAQYDKLVKGSTADVISGAYAQLASARAQLQRLEDGAEPAQIQAAEAQVRQAETALYLAQIQLDKATVRAPITGIVSKVNIAAGALAAPGNPVAIVLSPEVKIVIPIEEVRMADIAVGQPAQIRVNAYPGESFEGEVTLIAPELDPATRTVQVTVKPVDGAGKLAPGMFATVELLAE